LANDSKTTLPEVSRKLVKANTSAQR